MFYYSYSIGNGKASRRFQYPGEEPVITEVPYISEGQAISDEASYEKSWLRTKQKPELISPRGEVSIVDLFCGCGGLTLGVEEACSSIGYKCKIRYASDIDENAMSVFQNNFHPEIIDQDPIENTIDSSLGEPLSEKEKAFKEKVGKIDLLVAGPPCQGNSDLNNHTRRTDSRNLLYLRAVRCAEILMPESIIIENVPGVLHDVHGVLQTANDKLKKLGYHVDYSVVDMSKIGVPQSRRRMFLLASRCYQPCISDIFQYPRETRNISWAIDDLLGKVDDEDVYNSPANSSITNKKRIDYLFDHDLYDLPNEERPDCQRLKPHRYEAVYGRMYWNRPSPTITGGFGSNGQGRFVHPKERRTLTPHEAARVQFFPDFFSFNGVKRRALQQIIGNAVPSKAGFVVASQLLIHALYGDE